jgi:23S rRNA (adenine2503-C2)-methyltransferase
MLRDEPITGEGIPKPNIVYMGMGEPFRNYDAVVESIHILMASWGLNIGARKIAVSTSGDIPGIERFAHESWQVRLSVSLHAANNALRTKLVPLNKKYPLEDLLAALSGYIITTGRQITFEWTLIKDINDQPRDAEELAAVVHRLGVKRASVNLIPLNPVPGLPYATPPWPVCTQFRDLLDQRGVTVTLRKERGGDILAACGQLARRHTV